MSAVLVEWADKKKEELASWWHIELFGDGKQRTKGVAFCLASIRGAATKSATNNPVLSVLEYDKGFRPG